VPRDGERADRAHADRVAVGRALCHGVDADGEGAAGAIVDYDRLAQVLRQLRRDQARDVVGGAAGRLRDDETQRPLRELSGRGCCQNKKR
jgi:hypothetical protein